MLKYVYKRFSQLNKIKKFLPYKSTDHIREKQLKLQENKLYNGIDFRNTNELKSDKREIFYPKQHPKFLNSTDTSIISYNPPKMALTKFEHIPPSVSEFNDPEFESPKDSKELDIAILGPPNAGKSSLMNKLIGGEISAVSSKYGTTYDKVEGIFTDIHEKIQIVFNDTPGATKISNSFRSRRISTKAWSIIPDCDKIIFVIDSVKHLDIVTSEAIKRLLSHKFTPSMLKVINKIKSSREEDMSIEQLVRIQQEVDKSGVDNLDYEAKTISSILVMNKVDLVTNKRKLKSLQEELEDIGHFDKVFHVSCETGYGILNLLNYLKSESVRRPWKFHPELKSAQSDQEKCEEILRSLLFNRFYKEVPYDCLNRMTSWVPFNNGEIKIKFQIEVRYEHQIPMFLGEKGRVIKELREELNKKLTVFYHMPVTTNILLVKRRRGIHVESLNDHVSLA